MVRLHRERRGQAGHADPHRERRAHNRMLDTLAALLLIGRIDVLGDVLLERSLVLACIVEKPGQTGLLFPTRGSEGLGHRCYGAEVLIEPLPLACFAGLS